MNGFDTADSFIIFIYFYLHDGFRLVVEFRANVTTGMFVILVLMQDGVDVNLTVVSPLHEFGDYIGGFIRRIDVVHKIPDAIYDDQSQIRNCANGLFDYCKSHFGRIFPQT